MIGNSAITVVDPNGVCQSTWTGEGEVIRLELDVLGERADLAIVVKNERARLADIVPLARVVSEKIADKVGEIARRNGTTIPCCKRCSACCNYLVPLAIPEVFRLRQEVLDMPVVRRLPIEQACLTAARRILDKPLPESFTEEARAGAADRAAALLNTASNWYAEFKLSCPFLDKDVCTIYDQRPMACREYWVTGSSQACGGGAGEPERIYIPARMSEVLGRLAGELEGTNVEALIMPLVLMWTGENPQRDERTWPAPMMVERFIEIVAQAMAKGSAKTAVCA